MLCQPGNAERRAAGYFGVSSKRKIHDLRVGDHPSYMAPLAVQIAWLSEAGFTSADCYWKYLDFTIFGGVKG